MAEVNVILEKIKKRDKELIERATKTHEYINKITKTSDKEIKELKTKLEKSDIARLKPKHITKIIDIMPNDMDSLKTLFASEPITLKQEDLSKILECLK